MSEAMTSGVELKLNYKRTLQIGFAFFGILLLWQVYDSWCPTFLTDIVARRVYHMSSAQLKAEDAHKILNVQWIVGIIMACDNLAALILLPIFGSLSDRTHTPIGKRMPFILVGTFVSAFAFPFIPLFFHFNNVVGMIAMMAVVLIFTMMYRNPAVALMPDITPKPLRAKANGLINIMGYMGGAFATVLGIFLKLSDYINVRDEGRRLLIIEAPFVIASVLMILSALVLFFSIDENKLAEELKEEMAIGEMMAAVENPVRDDAPMSEANRRMLLSILAAEFLWFMADNAISTYIGNYVIYYLNAASSATMIMTIVGGASSIVGFATAGSIADRIGRKWTVSCGLALSAFAIFISCFVRPTGNIVGLNGEFSFPAFFAVSWIIKGYGMALVHSCSFPMVVELCPNSRIGQFTGYYYAASMSAQTITPVALGFVFRAARLWRALPVYSTVLYTLSLIVFTLCVKNIRTRKIRNLRGLEAIDDDPV